ncbi:hypothetical protein EO087_13975 [Dyella sp. M7H15-1]|uniref:D-Ala-D-Ala carboxypeptidase family metallohydrolase n=1 Tax=Dyella sp. M7H15-1 TaxID=2501295 RepID=UPI001004DF8D|nr:D-Ala-D-Ala carboxypeptidase family metallohydrolase [Dyella sp. M7H15-1]QAU24964.1 hypothetical protein EO087_13975 [Dyella sp. M7H15-1]
MFVVNYQSYRVSDERVQQALERIADELGCVVRVTSGDRGHVPAGGATNSLHLIHHAADFHCEGVTDATAFDLIRSRRREIFGDATGLAFRFQVIHHGSYTATQGEHLHLGYVPDEPRYEGNYRGFLVEGLTPTGPTGKGRYHRVEGP